MEKLVILRMFASLPLFGLLLPDCATFITSSFGSISPVHIYIEVALILFIMICTLKIAVIRKAGNTAGNRL
ncbi:hypothetical protein LX99_00446 [Mucilaginibacter oryzae]|uniref:Uncharacterized protein n=1 Tax=Mucilaginibacter oryzae TaxID=468058 RepID=A0A316HP41_9SPHI|nr:hypothetical protein LX99_00446 [Mucilaginibacter oryzae]